MSAKRYAANSEAYHEKMKKWNAEHPGYSAAYDKKRRQIDPQFRLVKTIRTRLNDAIRYSYKSGSSIRDLGCTVSDLKLYLEKLFQPDMTWENQGQWHIDHIIPLSRFDLSNREQFLKACHFTNLQPLWAKDNIKKGVR
jgi:hypothetical protein